MMFQTLDENCYSWLYLESYFLARHAKQFSTSAAVKLGLGLMISGHVNI